jgi:hypothetical protein
MKLSPGDPLHIADECVVAQRTAVHGVPPERIRLVALRFTKKRGPVADPLQEWLDPDQHVVPAGEMRPRAAPAIIRGALDDPRPHRVAFYVASRSEKMALVHHVR